MKKLFLSSSFKDVVSIFENFIEEKPEGKKVTFIPTASIHEKVNFYVKSGKKALEKMGLVIDELEVSTASESEIFEKLKSNDYIYVTGGNTFFLLQELKKKGADKLIVEQINLGKLYIGESAGSMVLSPNIEYVKDMDNCNEAPELKDFTALNVIDFYPLPHHTNSPFEKIVNKIIEHYESVLPLKPISNSNAILVSGETIEVK